jgi:hypothetical protein
MSDIAGQMLEIEVTDEDALFVEDGDTVYGPDPELRVGFEDVAANVDGYVLVGGGC